MIDRIAAERNWLPSAKVALLPTPEGPAPRGSHEERMARTNALLALGALVALVRRLNLELKSAGAMLPTAKARNRQACALDDPQVGAEIDDVPLMKGEPTAGGREDLEMQWFPSPGKLGFPTDVTERHAGGAGVREGPGRGRASQARLLRFVRRGAGVGDPAGTNRAGRAPRGDHAGGVELREPL